MSVYLLRCLCHRCFSGDYCCTSAIQEEVLLPLSRNVWFPQFMHVVQEMETRASWWLLFQKDELYWIQFKAIYLMFSIYGMRYYLLHYTPGVTASKFSKLHANFSNVQAIWEKVRRVKFTILECTSISH